MKKKFNIARIVWVGAIFLELIVILIMVMDYKINYEYLEPTTSSLYFFECDDGVCTTEVEDKNKNIYSVFDCEYVTCPEYKKIINDDYALLLEDNSFILYNYKTGNVITSGYSDYRFINNDYIIVKRDNKEGVIDLEDNLVVNVEYEQIGYNEGEYLTGYNTSNIIAKKDDKYGIISFKDGSIIEEFKYDENQIQSLLELLKKRKLDKLYKEDIY